MVEGGWRYGRSGGGRRSSLLWTVLGLLEALGLDDDVLVVDFLDGGVEAEVDEFDVGLMAAV